MGGGRGRKENDAGRRPAHLKSAGPVSKDTTSVCPYWFFLFFFVTVLLVSRMAGSLQSHLAGVLSP